MATKITLRVQNRNPKAPIRNLPNSIEVNERTSIDDVKQLIASAIHFKDPNRIGLFPVNQKSSFKDRNALIAEQTEVMKPGIIAVKDLGPQISWQTVFIVEYAGPLLIHILAVLLRPNLYTGISARSSMSNTQILSMVLITLHFLKRELEIAFVHKFSATTMPLFNLFKNSIHYWIFAGVNLAYWIYSPTASIAQTPSLLAHIFTAIGVALYAYGEICNLLSHVTLSNLRSTGGTERGIPTGYGFRWVTCPNYLFETVAWTGVCLVTKSWAAVVFTILAFVQMRIWAEGKERRYRAEFGERYKGHRFYIIPGLA